MKNSSSELIYITTFSGLQLNTLQLSTCKLIKYHPMIIKKIFYARLSFEYCELMKIKQLIIRKFEEFVRHTRIKHMSNAWLTCCSLWCLTAR